MGREERKRLIERLEQKRQSKLLCLLTSDRDNASGSIRKDFIPVAYSHLRQSNSFKRLDILMFTLGGDPIVAFALCRAFHELFSELCILVPENCHSAGTLFALGANKIIMGPMATLSPYDPSLPNPLGPLPDPRLGPCQPIKVSWKSMQAYNDWVRSFFVDSNPEVMATAFRILAARIHPLVIGDAFRSGQLRTTNEHVGKEVIGFPSEKR